MNISKKERTRLLLLFLTIVFLTIALITSVTDNVKQIIDNKNSINIMETNYEELISSESSLKSEVTKLSDPDYVARYAKEKYLYSTEGEIIIRFE